MSNRWARNLVPALAIALIGLPPAPTGAATLQDSDDWVCNHAPAGPRKDAACARLRTDTEEDAPEAPRPHRHPPAPRPVETHTPPPTTSTPAHPVTTTRTPPKTPPKTTATTRSPPAKPVTTTTTHTPVPATQAGPPTRAPTTAASKANLLQRSVACLTYQAEAERIAGYVRDNRSFDRVLALAVADGPKLNGATYLGTATPDRAVRGLARAGFAWRGQGKFSDYAFDICKRGGLL